MLGCGFIRGEFHDARQHTVFTVKDVMASLAYYRDKLGFDVAFEYGNPTFYVGLCSRRGEPAPDRRRQTPRLPGHGAVVDLRRRRRCASCRPGEARRRVLKAPKDYDYGLRDFDVADLDGNMIFFGMELQKAS